VAAVGAAVVLIKQQQPVARRKPSTLSIHFRTETRYWSASQRYGRRKHKMVQVERTMRIRMERVSKVKKAMGVIKWSL